MLTERCFDFGDKILFVDNDWWWWLWWWSLLVEDDIDKLLELLILPLLLFPDVFINRRELLRCEIGTVVDDVDVLTVFTLASDNDKIFFTASGECAPFKKQKQKINLFL